MPQAHLKRACRLFLRCVCPDNSNPACFFCAFACRMAALEKQSSTGTTHQLAQTLDNLQLADEPLPWDHECCQFTKPNGSQCGRRKPQNGDYCWQHKAAAEAAEAPKTYEVAVIEKRVSYYKVTAFSQDEAEEKALNGDGEGELGDPNWHVESVKEVGKHCTRTRAPLSARSD